MKNKYNVIDTIVYIALAIFFFVLFLTKIDLEKNILVYLSSLVVSKTISVIMDDNLTEEFIIPVSDTQAYKQFGNSVAVPVIRAVAKRMIDEMNALPCKK